jgi:hypothetical protein
LCLTKSRARCAESLWYEIFLTFLSESSIVGEGYNINSGCDLFCSYINLWLDNDSSASLWLDFFNEITYIEKSKPKLIPPIKETNMIHSSRAGISLAAQVINKLENDVKTDRAS